MISGWWTTLIIHEGHSWIRHVSCFCDMGIGRYFYVGMEQLLHKEAEGVDPSPKETWEHYQDDWEATYNLEVKWPEKKTE